jgi:hypothetical protein
VSPSGSACPGWVLTLRWALVDGNKCTSIVGWFTRHSWRLCGCVTLPNVSVHDTNYIPILRQEVCIGMTVNLGALVKRQCFPCPHPEGIWGSKGVAAFIINLDTPGKKPVYPFSRRVGAPHIRSGRFGERMNGNLKTCSK